MAQIAVSGYELELLSSPGESRYDHTYTDDEYVTSTILIRVSQSDEILKTVLIGSGGGSTTIHKTSFVVETDRVVLCCSDSIFCFTIPELHLLWRTRADSVTCFEIVRHDNTYIVHGELEISRLNRDGNILWQQTGADIFITMNDNPGDFQVTDSHILATDWDNRRYKFDFEGNLIG